MTVGEKALARGGVEVKRRDSDTDEIVAAEQAPERLRTLIHDMFGEIAVGVVPVEIPDTSS